MSSSPVDDPVTVELAPDEAAGGVDKTISLLTGRVVTVRVPAGTVDGALLRLPDADTSDPAHPKDVILRVRVAGTPPTAATGPTSVSGAAAAGAASAAPDPAGLRPRRVTVLYAAVAVVLLVLVGVAYYVHHRSTTPAAAPDPVPSVSPSLDKAAYQALLTTADAQLTTAFQALTAAKTPAAVQTATHGLRDTLAAQVTALRAVPGPPALLDALTALQAEADHTASAATSLAICGSASAVPALTGTPAADQVRAAAKALASDGYTFGSFLPAASATQTRQPASGTYTRKIQRTGQGRLTIVDNGPTDAAISLVPVGTRTATFTVYVRAGATFTVTGVKDGSYQIFQATGVDWDDATAGFTRTCGFKRFDAPTTFKTTGGSYTKWSISLTPSPDGHSSLSPVEPDQFPVG